MQPTLPKCSLICDLCGEDALGPKNLWELLETMRNLPLMATFQRELWEGLVDGRVGRVVFCWSHSKTLPDAGGTGLLIENIRLLADPSEMV